jgi:glycosyltransferase involved in cell wall biosynthesis
MFVSVIIPTYNRAEVLQKTLEGYAGQCGDHRLIEVLVVDDGSKDNTSLMVEECCKSFPISLRYFRQENRGLAAARNHGIREARGELILFGDDDIIPSHNMVAEHVAWHCRFPEENVGVLGQVDWAPEVHPTPFMVWSNLYGAQFNFGRFQPGMEVEFWHAYFCNTSVKSGFLKRNGMFDETFRKYGWEDIEFSYRLYQNGYRVRYSPKALGYHYKYEKFQDTLRRVLELNRSSAVFKNTDAGKCLFEQINHQTSQAAQRKTLVRRLLRSFKKPVMPLLRYLFDTQIPFPARVYEYVFYDYVWRNSPAP